MTLGGSMTRGATLAALHFWSQAVYAAGYFFERARRGWAVDSRDNPDGPGRTSGEHDAATAADTKLDERRCLTSSGEK